MNDLFERARLPMQEVLVRYGITPNRAGFIICPFHAEKTASCKIYEYSFYCFGCGAGGDAVAFVSRMEDISPKQAAIELVGDTPQKQLSYIERRRLIDNKQQKKRSEYDKVRLIRKLLKLCRILNLAVRIHSPSCEPTGLCSIGLLQLDRLDYLIERADEIPVEEFEKYYGEEVKAIEHAIGRCL